MIVVEGESAKDNVERSTPVLFVNAASPGTVPETEDAHYFPLKHQISHTQSPRT